MYITYCDAYIHRVLPKLRSRKFSRSRGSSRAAGELRGRGPAESCSVAVEILPRAKSADFD